MSPAGNFPEKCISDPWLANKSAISRKKKHIFINVEI